MLLMLLLTVVLRLLLLRMLLLRLLLLHLLHLLHGVIALIRWVSITPCHGHRHRIRSSAWHHGIAPATRHHTVHHTWVHPGLHLLCCRHLLRHVSLLLLLLLL